MRLWDDSSSGPILHSPALPSSPMSDSRTIARVFLIGAGPGDPGLLTLRGAARLAAADYVLYDYLVNPRILDHASEQAELVCLGRHGQGRILPQDEIHRRMIEAARAGRTVARLKGGDTAIFARTAEEVAALEAAGIPYEIIPGVSAVQAASSCTGIPLTHRDHSSCVALITGQQGRASGTQPLDMGALAEFPGTLAYYMGVTTAADWSAELIACGKPTSTPVAVIRHASLPNQATWVTTLGKLHDVLEENQIRPPAIVLVGEAVDGRSHENWFAQRPLFGRTIVVTRPAEQAGGMAAELEELGAKVLYQPAIEIGPPDTWAPVDRALQALASFDWIVFSSSNGVHYFLNRLFDEGRDLRALRDVKLAAIGPATAAALDEWRLRLDVQPDEYRAEALASALADSAAGQRFLLVRASRGREVLAETLVAAGGDVEQIVAYASQDVERPDEEIAAALAAGEIDWLTVTSSAIARSLVRLFGANLGRTRLAAISPLTAGVLIDAGYPPAAVAEEYVARGVIDAIVRGEVTGEKRGTGVVSP